MNGSRIGVVFVAALLGLSLINPLYPREQFLQHLPTVPSLIALYWLGGRRILSPSSVRALLAFVVLHIVGARYIYSFVPYDRVLEAMTGQTATALFDLSRNHYDRFVHLAFGGLFVLPVAEAGMRYGRMRRRWAAWFGVAVVLALSALYESFEWGLTLALSPGQAENYNGQQGDMWDAQKDMALAALGAILAAWPASRANVLVSLANHTDSADETLRFAPGSAADP